MRCERDLFFDCLDASAAIAWNTSTLISVLLIRPSSLFWADCQSWIGVAASSETHQKATDKTEPLGRYSSTRNTFAFWKTDFLPWPNARVRIKDDEKLCTHILAFQTLPSWHLVMSDTGVGFASAIPWCPLFLLGRNSRPSKSIVLILYSKQWPLWTLVPWTRAPCSVFAPGQSGSLWCHFGDSLKNRFLYKMWSLHLWPYFRYLHFI